MWKNKRMEDETINKISLAIEVQYFKEMLCKLLQLHENKWLELNEKGNYVFLLQAHQRDIFNLLDGIQIIASRLFPLRQFTYSFGSFCTSSFFFCVSSFLISIFSWGVSEDFRSDPMRAGNRFESFFSLLVASPVIVSDET